MAIKFENEIEKNNNEELLDDSSKKSKKEKASKSALQKSLTAFLILSIISVVFAICFTFTFFIVGIPVLFLWIAWLCVVILPTIVTIGCIWVSEGWRNFNRSFMDFNNKVADGSNSVFLFIEKAFPYLISIFSCCVVTFLVLSIINFVKDKEKSKSSKSKLAISIILTVIFIIALVFDVIYYIKK